jgi:hypothetical protein
MTLATAPCSRPRAPRAPRGPARGGGGCWPQASPRLSLPTTGRRNILVSRAGSLRSPTPPTRCPQYRPPLPRGHAPNDAILLGAGELQRRSQARAHYGTARAHRQRPPLPSMQRPARRAVSWSEEHLRVHLPTRWLLPCDLLVRGEAIDADHGSSPPTSARAAPLCDLGCDVVTGHNKPPDV